MYLDHKIYMCGRESSIYKNFLSLGWESKVIVHGEVVREYNNVIRKIFWVNNKLKLHYENERN